MKCACCDRVLLSGDKHYPYKLVDKSSQEEKDIYMCEDCEELANEEFTWDEGTAHHR